MFSKISLTFALLGGTAFGAVSSDSRPGFQSALLEMKNGRYEEAVSLFDQLPSQDSNGLDVLYWSGVSLFNMQKFEPARFRLERVLSRDEMKEYPEAAYYLGQALYAQQDYRRALQIFEMAARGGPQVAPALFYKGYLHSLLKEPENAVKSFRELVSLRKVQPQWQQAGHFQIGEVRFAELSSTPDEIVKRDLALSQVIPAYELAVEANPQGELAAQARARISEAYRLIGQAGPETLGRVPIPAKPWLVLLNQEVKFDSNILGEADEKTVKSGNPGATFTRLSFFGRYEKVFRKRVAFSPELGVDGSYHFRRDVPEVYGNDNVNFNPALRLRFDHLIADRSASTLLEYEFSHGRRDYLQNFTQPFYGTSHNIILGERASLFSTGVTFLAFNVRYYESQLFAGLTSYTPGISLSQGITLTDSMALNVTAGFDQQISNLPYFDQKTFRMSLSTSVPDVLWGMSLDLFLSVSAVDTMLQQDVRGTEISLTPMATLTKYLDEAYRYSVNVNYMYMRNFSKAKQDYQMAKHMIGVGLGITL